MFFCACRESSSCLNTNTVTISLSWRSITLANDLIKILIIFQVSANVRITFLDYSWNSLPILFGVRFASFVDSLVRVVWGWKNQWWNFFFLAGCVTYVETRCPSLTREISYQLLPTHPFLSPFHSLCCQLKSSPAINTKKQRKLLTRFARTWRWTGHSEQEISSNYQLLLCTFGIFTQFSSLPSFFAYWWPRPCCCFFLRLLDSTKILF